MDLVNGVRRVLVLMEHNATDGSPKLLPECTLPLTGAGVVNRVITDLGVMDVTPDGIEVTELADGVTHEEFAQRTGVPVRFQLG